MNKPILVAEIGGNHGGSLDWAKEAIRVAAECGVDYVKFQKRDIGSLPESSKTKARTDIHAFGATEYEHRKVLEFSEEQRGRRQNNLEGLQKFMIAGGLHGRDGEVRGSDPQRGRD